MKPKPPKETELTAETAKKVLAFDVANLLRKVKSGRPLSRYERQIIEAKVAPDGRPTPEVGPTYAKNQAELAKLLGTSRQLIAYHNRQPGSPGHRPDGRYPVGEWREYLAVNGRVVGTGGAPHHGQGNASFSDLADFGAMRGLERAATVLPLVVSEALEGRMTEQEQAKLVGEIWAALACRLTGYITADGPRSVPLTTPPQIVAMCAKVGVRCPTGLDIGEDTED
jgi:hypothetical protein